MASRLKQNPTKVFDVFCEVAAPTATNAAWILWKYPDDYADAGVLKAIAEFSFPLGAQTESVETVQIFAFVLTDGDGRYTFGYCRHSPRSDTCLCMCTSLPWTTLFHKLINHLATSMNNAKESEVQALLHAAYNHDIPKPDEHFVIESSIGKNKLEVNCPDYNRLPSVQENRDLMELYNGVNAQQMIGLYASLLRERRIIFTSRRLAQISSCVLAAATLIHPMHWQHIFIPVLPAHLISYLHAPMPFLIGVPTVLMDRARTEMDMADIVVIDLDTQEFNSPFRDYSELPNEVRTLLKSQLEKCVLMLGDGLIRSFVRATCALIGDWRTGLKVNETTGKLSFDTDKFVYNQRPSLRVYLDEIRHLQIFQQFIEERVDALNSGHPIDDEFEQEARVFEYRKTKASDKMREKGREALTGLTEKMNKLTKEATLMPIIAGPNYRNNSPAMQIATSSSPTNQPISRNSSSSSFSKGAAQTARETVRTIQASATRSRDRISDKVGMPTNSHKSLRHESDSSSPPLDARSESYDSKFYTFNDEANSEHKIESPAKEIIRKPDVDICQNTPNLIDWGDEPTKQSNAEINFDPLQTRKRRTSKETPKTSASIDLLSLLGNSSSVSSSNQTTTVKSTNPATSWVVFD